MATTSDQTSRTYTFLFTDLEGSTRLWEQFPQEMKAALKRHDELLLAAVESSNGKVVKFTGDGLMASFLSALDGVHACLQAQQSLLNEKWSETGSMKVRMGLHTGEAQPRGGDYYGPAVNRAARLMSVAHGGQVLISAAAAILVLDLLPEATTLRDLGEHRLKDLARPEHVFQLVHPHLQSDFPPLTSLDHRPNNLPAQPTPFIGRDTELGEITKRLHSGSVRLLTLTGLGGIGKTRLALQAAADLIDNFKDGVYFVDLAPIRDPQFVLPTIAHTVGFKEISDRTLLAGLQAFLQTKRMLLLLDNFEQVTVAATQVVDLLRDCPNLKILVTSREALHVRDEYVYPVPALALPKFDLKGASIVQLTQYEAVRLFIERARTVKPDFSVTNENAPEVAEICVRLEGLPLAIELAAARIRLFSPQALLDRLGSRLQLLRGGARDLPLRQQTLRGAIDWSYELLDPGEKRLFDLLSVFVGGSSFDSVEVVASKVKRLDETGIDILDGLSMLVDKSLIRQVELESGKPRLLMLEMIREYASERLEEDPEFNEDARRAHGSYFADFTQRKWEGMTRSSQEEAVGDLVTEIKNVQTALDYWVQARDLAQLSKFVDPLWRLYDERGWYHAAVQLTNNLLIVLGSTPSTPELAQEEIVLQTSLARALLAIKGYTPDVKEAYNRALELAQAMGDIPQLFPVLRGLSSLYLYFGEYVKGVQMGEKILSLAERQDDASMRVVGHLVMGANLAFSESIHLGLAHLQKGIENFDPSRHRSRRFQLGPNPGVSCFTVSALLLWMVGFPDQALKRANEAVDLSSRMNHPYSMAFAMFHASMLHLWRREGELVQDRAKAVLEIAEEHEFLVWRAVATCLYGAALAGMNQTSEGLALISKGIDLYQGLKSPPVFWPLLLYIKAGVLAQGGKPEDGLELLNEAMRIATSSPDDTMTSEFFRLKGELLLAITPENAVHAEPWLMKALELTQNQQARMLELRAAISLNRLWRVQGRAEQGKRLLSDIYHKMTEGFDTADLVEARELLRS